jgi:hypothetical protein
MIMEHQETSMLEHTCPETNQIRNAGKTEDMPKRETSHEQQNVNNSSAKTLKSNDRAFPNPQPSRIKQQTSPQPGKKRSKPQAIPKAKTRSQRTIHAEQDRMQIHPKAGTNYT